MVGLMTSPAGSRLEPRPKHYHGPNHPQEPLMTQPTIFSPLQGGVPEESDALELQVHVQAPGLERTDGLRRRLGRDQRVGE